MILHKRLGIFAAIGTSDDTYQLIVSRIATPTLMLYAVIRLLDAIAIPLLRIGADPSVQVRIVQPEFQPVGVRRIVADPKVDIVSRPLKVLLISDIQQISLRKPLINLQVFLSL